MPKSRLQTVHPGEVLTEEFLSPLGLSQNRLASRSESLPAASTKSRGASAR
jgi:plasmid maintenance system antidote protein VapI